MLTAISLTNLAGAGEPTEPPLFVENLGVFSLHAQSPNNVFEQFYPTEVLPLHGKIIDLASRFIILDSSSNATSVTVWLDWRFGSSGPFQTSAPETIDVAPGVRSIYNTRVILPVSPSQVSVHIQNNGPGGPVIVSGALSHQSVFVPEPATAVLSILAAAGFVRVARRITPR
jgi:hypothetical protein